jgi:hypothetical protein
MRLSFFVPIWNSEWMRSKSQIRLLVMGQGIVQMLKKCAMTAFKKSLRYIEKRCLI